MRNAASSRQGSRQQLMRALERSVRITSAQSNLFSQAVADRLGINGSDLECLDLIALKGPVTAGELARETGLTSGAITGLIDRLEKAGYARRMRDAEDRRRVLVEPRMDRIERRIAPLYASLAGAMAALWSGYDDRQLEFLVAFIDRSGAVMREEIGKLRSAPKRAQVASLSP